LRLAAEPDGIGPGSSRAAPHEQGERAVAADLAVAAKVPGEDEVPIDFLRPQAPPAAAARPAENAPAPRARSVCTHSLEALVPRGLPLEKVAEKIAAAPHGAPASPAAPRPARISGRPWKRPHGAVSPRSLLQSEAVSDRYVSNDLCVDSIFLGSAARGWKQ
jgi:hypothetical protein